MDYKIFIYIIFGVLPSLTWLSYYLRKDIHPESKKMILKIFFYGALVTIPVFLAQMGLSVVLGKISLPTIFISLLYWFVVISFTEELFKYLVVKQKVLNHYEFDEPLDTMLYMVIAALGFAALENILYLFSPTSLSFNDALNRTIIISLIRFIGATFLHTLCSAAFGYFLAMSFLETKNRLKMVFLGFLLATILHGFYDFSIMTLEGPMKIIMPAATLIVLAVFVFTGFERLKKIKSICKVN